MYKTKCLNDKSVHKYMQFRATKKEVNDKYLENSDMQYRGPGRVTSIFELST